MFKLESFFDLSSDLFCLLNKDCRFVHVNSACKDLLGWTPDFLADQLWFEYLHSDDLRDSKQALQKEQFEVINRYLHADGSYRWLAWSGTRSDEGMIYAIARDVTAQQMEIEALKIERQSLYSVLDQLPAFLYLQPKNHEVGFYNQRFREIFGDPQGRKCYETIAGLDQPCPGCPTFRVFDTNQPQLWEFQDSTTGKFYQIYDYPFVNLNGEPMVVEMGLDITQQKQAEAELRKIHHELEQRVIDRTAELTQTMSILQQRELELTERNQQLEKALQDLKMTQSQLIQIEKISSLGQLVAGVAHEVNNPVSFIAGNLSHVRQAVDDLTNLIALYQKHLPSPPPEISQEIEEMDLPFLLEDLAKMISSMKLGTDRIRDIMQSLRKYSRADGAEKQAVDIHEGIEATLIILSHRFKANPERPMIQVVQEYGELPLVECYSGQLNQVFTNLIANAIDALEESNVGKSFKEIEQAPNVIRIRTSVHNHSVAVQIADNGCGMTEEVKQKLFSAFFTTKVGEKGTGLGLSISKQIVEETHGGCLEVNSELNKGTEFIIKLPLSKGIK